MNKGFVKILLLLITTVASFTACNNRWDDYIEVNGTLLKGTVMEGLKGRADMSTFYNMVVATGYDSILSNSVEVTVLAPTNDALSAYASASIDEKKELVRNHIAFLSYNSNKLSEMSKLMMINGKNLTLSKLSIDGSVHDLLCNNGIIHKVDKAVPASKSILEYLYSLPTGVYPQADSIRNQTKRVMDMEKSIQIGVTANGQPKYDTVWTYTNHLLDRVSLHNEDSTYTLVLLEQTDYNTLAAKYSTYMQQPTKSRTDSLVFDELYSDLTFKGINPTNTSAVAVSGVNVDFSTAATTSEYEASNGVVRIMNGISIKMYNNKIKPLQIEGEAYQNVLDPVYVLTRSRSWASGGKDVVVSSRTAQLVSGRLANALGQMRDTTFTYTFYYSQGASLYNTSNNFFLEYSTKLYSVEYDVYWVAHCDQSGTFAFRPGFDKDSLMVEQKMFMSFPLKAKLSRLSSGEVRNNSLGDFALAATTIAGRTNPATGKPYEAKLRKYRLMDIPTQYVSHVTTSFDGIVQCPTAGKATIWVTNTANGQASTSATGGLMFLDYIKLVPRVNVND